MSLQKAKPRSALYK